MSALVALALTGATAPPDLLLQQVTLSGTRTIVDIPVARGPVLTTSYPVVEHDVGLGSRTLSFGSPAALPDGGFQPVTESVTSLVAFPDGTPTETLSIDTETRIDRGAHQSYQVDVVRSMTTTDPGQIAATEHVVEAGAGANGVRFGGDDLVRTTSADGSFDERGFLSGADVHTLHVGADFAASLHVERPGANLRDVNTSPPSGNGPAATITATVSRRGRMPPVVTETYTVPRWFPAQAAPTLAERVVTPNAPLPVECGTPAPASGALFVHVSRRQIDPTGNIRELVRDTYYGASYAAVCRIESSSTAEYDVKGTQFGRHSERTVLVRTPR